MVEEINISSKVNDNATKESLSITRQEWWWPLLFLLSMSLTGLNFPLGYIGIVVVLINRFIHDRYDFIIALTLLFGGYALMSDEDFPVKLQDIALVISCLGIFIYKKTPELKKVTFALIAYALALVLIARTSDETMVIQLRRLRGYLMIMYFFIPLMAFSGREFDIKYFFKRLMIFALIICWFYIIDGFILNGWVLLPDASNQYEYSSTFTNLIWYPLQFTFPRKYPPGLYILALCLLPITKYYKLSTKQWIVVLLAFATSRTLSVIGGLLITYVIFQGHFKQVAKYGVIAIVIVTSMYFVDRSTGGFLRIQSTIDQFISLDAVQDEEDLAEFGSGRMSQIIPKMEVLYDLDREWLGLGFLHPELTTNPKYWIKNELYTDVTKAEEVATAVEVSAVQTILDVGYIGLILQTLFYLYIYYAIRHLKYSRYYLMTFVVISIFGIGGFAGVTTHHGLLLLGLSLSVVLLANKSYNRLEYLKY